MTDPNDETAMKALFASVPKGWAVGPTHCPIGIDSNPIMCSAGYCIACLWIRAHWDDGPEVELTIKRRAIKRRVAAK